MNLEEIEDKLHEDFVFFANIIFKTTLQLGPLTNLQEDFCRTLQDEPTDRLFLSCFRGFGKSYLLSLFCIWKLYNDPDEKVVVVSASAPRAKDFVRFSKDVIKKTPVLKHMIDTTRQNRKHRTSVYGFDIVGSKPSQFASLKAVGIGGQITGARATVVVFDDVEVTNNSQTESAREKLSDGMREANALLLPKGKIYVIGTPQSRFSIYNHLDGFKTIKYPIFYPAFGYENLAPYLIKHRDDNPSCIGQITESQRFTSEDIQNRREAYGNSLFQLQYQLDTSMSDGERFPLQTKFLYVSDCHPERFPTKFEDVGTQQYQGLEFKVLRSASNYSDFYTRSIVAVDQAGKGLDETAAVVLKCGGGRVFIVDSYYSKEGYDERTMLDIISMARRNNANTIVCERNYGGGMFTELLIKYVKENCEGELGITDVINKGKKSRRIIETVEPFLTAGKLVADLKWFRKEIANPQYNMWQQAASIDLDDIYSSHDDRIDALATGLAFLKQELAISEEDVDRDYRQKVFDLEIESISNATSYIKYGRTKDDVMGRKFGNALNNRRRR